jgi:hypothetical protein
MGWYGMKNEKMCTMWGFMLDEGEYPLMQEMVRSYKRNEICPQM